MKGLTRRAVVVCSCMVVVLAGGCSADDGPGDVAASTQSPPTESTEADPGEPADAEGMEDQSSEVVIEEVDCSAEGLDDTGEFSFVAAYYVVDSSLGALCFGEADDTLISAWGILTDIVPTAQLGDLALFGGFDADPTDEEPTLAFVNSRDDTDQFQMSVNLTEAEALPEEFALTMVHEFAHVFTGVPTELDRTLSPEECTTWDNGEGCYVPGSLMDNWTREFWSDELAFLDPSAEPDAEEGQERCDADEGFFGAYAASHPEEDFAESFAAWVLDVPADNAAQQQRYTFLEHRPGLLEFRDRAASAGYGPQPNNFDDCGLSA